MVREGPETVVLVCCCVKARLAHPVDDALQHFKTQDKPRYKNNTTDANVEKKSAQAATKIRAKSVLQDFCSDRLSIATEKIVRSQTGRVLD